jgi:hypothetical protein
MNRTHGDFVLLIDGNANCYASDYPTIVDRLNSEYPKRPASEFLITQIVGTVNKPTKPVINCIYNVQKV